MSEELRRRKCQYWKWWGKDGLHYWRYESHMYFFSFFFLLCSSSKWHVNTLHTLLPCCSSKWHVNALHTLLLCCSLSETRIVALVKNRTSDMTVAIGDGNETSISLWKLVFLILSKQQPGSYFVSTFSLFWVLTGANDVSMIQMDDVVVGISG